MDNSESSEIITVTDGGKVFGSFTALSNINLSIKRGEILTLLGPSGCGKSTLLRALAGFEGLSSGSLTIDGEDVSSVPPDKRPVNMVFQRYALFPHLDVFENVAFGLKVKGMAKAEIKDRVNDMLRIVQLEDFADRYIDQLSGGQSQRVALARALVNRPKVLLLDEPLAALDLKIRQHMLVEMKRIHNETGATFIYVTHDQDEALILSDRIVLMEQGRIVQVDTPQDMYARPASLFAAKFLGETNLFNAVLSKSKDGSDVAVTTSGFHFTSAAPVQLSAGQDVVVSIRPESLAFAAGQSKNRSFEGTVEDIVFIGSRSFYSVRLDDQFLIEVQVQRESRATLPSRGDRTRLSWDPENVVILPMH